MCHTHQLFEMAVGNDTFYLYGRISLLKQLYLIKDFFLVVRAGIFIITGKDLSYAKESSIIQQFCKACITATVIMY